MGAVPQPERAQVLGSHCKLFKPVCLGGRKARCTCSLCGSAEWVDSQLMGTSPDIAPQNVIWFCGCGHVPGADIGVLQAVGRDGLRTARPAVTMTSESEQHVPSLSNSSKSPSDFSSPVSHPMGR